MTEGLCADGVQADPTIPSKGGVLITMHRLSQGGADRVAILLANAFAEAGWRTEIVLLRDAGEGEPALLALLCGDVKISRAGPPMGSRHLELLRGLRFIRKRIAAVDPAIVLASSSNMGLVTGLASKRGRGRQSTRFVMKLTNPVVRPHDEWWPRIAYRRRLYGFIFGRFDRVLVLTDAERVKLERDFINCRDRFETVVNPYVMPAMVADPAPRDNGAPVTFLTTARMMPQKRLDRLLQAFAMLERRDTRLVILGDGPERARLNALAQTLGIADRVEMPGFVADVVAWYRHADLFLLSSDYEGLPAVVLEAMACDLPIITTDCFEGARSLFAGAERCEVVARNDVRAFARAVDKNAGVERRCGTLRPIALRYSLEAGTAAHVRALEALGARSQASIVTNGGAKTI